MEPTAAPWAKAPGGVGAGAPAHAHADRQPPLPPVSRGELTRAPWAPITGPALTGRPVEAAIVAQPRLPAPSPRAADASAAATWAPAAKRIHTREHLARFLRDQSAQEFVGFVLALNEAVKGRSLSDPCQVGPALEGLLAALGTLWRWVDEIPPSQHSLRYGNPAFREWFARMSQAAPQLVAGLLPPHLQPAAVELAPYFVDSFGNATRIDYGTGHETTFCALLFCLARLGVLGEGDMQGAVTRVFARYLSLMRKVQTTYWLEPAGSHGVWGLDDYQFLPFVWGSAQLVDHPLLKPASIHNSEALEQNSEDYLYLGCVRFVKQVKKGPLAETSPMLNDISGVPSWSKVNRGMVKMYQAEVLSKFPIMQHFLFGSLLPFDPEQQRPPGATGAAAEVAEQQPAPIAAAAAAEAVQQGEASAAQQGEAAAAAAAEGTAGTAALAGAAEQQQLQQEQQLAAGAQAACP